MPILAAMTAGKRPVPAGYEFMRILGSGGFGEVVLARHVQLKRLVAIKRIHAYVLADDDGVRRFEREAQLLATTEAPEIVRVYDLVRTTDGIHLVMEYVPGRPLSDLIDAGPVPADLALTALRDVASALATAARHRVVHRDVKPANVFVQPDGHAKLGDFGLARATADPAVFRTSTSTAMGTPAYFPPELGQQLSEPDERSDAYSFAVMAYETLTGAKPYESDDVISLITAHWRLTPPDPASVLPGFPRAAAEALLRAMDHDPSRRLLPSELVDVLTRVKPDRWPHVERSEPAPPPVGRSDPTVQGIAPPGSSPTMNVVPPARRHKRRWRWALVPAAGAVAVAVVAAWLLPQQDGSPAAPRPLRVSGVEVVSVPADATGSCPETTFMFEGTVRTNGEAGRVELRWRRPDGTLSTIREVDVRAGQRDVTARLSFGVSGSRPFEGTAQLQVVSPTVVNADRAITYTCPTG